MNFKLIKEKMRSLYLEKLIVALCLFQINIVAQEIKSLPIPSRIEFANQNISLERYDMRERFDREQIIVAYNHSVSILMIKRANKYFPIIEPILLKNRIPLDFKYLAVTESLLDPRAVSPAKAAGMWQLLPATAEQFGLEVNDEVDERFHIEKATEAACKYLNSAYRKYNNWTTVAISYNAGMGKISTELRKQQVDEGFDLYLTSESSRYMFRILAMKQFLENPRSYGYSVAKDDFYHTLRTKIVTVNDTVNDWTQWAIKQGITYYQLKDFNIWLRDSKLTNKLKKEYMITIPEKSDLNFDSSKIKLDYQFNIKFF